MLAVLGSIFRLVLFVVLGVFSLAIASIFIIGTLATLGLLILIAKIRGKDFKAKQYWEKRRSAYTWDFRSRGFKTHPETDRDATIIDVEVTEIDPNKKRLSP